VRKFLGPLLRKANCPTKIWILDHNFDLLGPRNRGVELSGAL